MFDTLFCNARIVDGTGTPWFWGSVSVQDGFIAAVLPRTTKLLSRRTVDLEGGILCPGFVDGTAIPDVRCFPANPPAVKPCRAWPPKNSGWTACPHPYATYPHILGRYARERGVLSLEEAIRKMTSLTGPQDPASAQGRHPARL